ncbi:MAG: protein kinase [Deltaproteobacteria bacterium]|nr:protein kinase [Deltaproteobacteria bacterium]
MEGLLNSLGEMFAGPLQLMSEPSNQAIAGGALVALIVAYVVLKKNKAGGIDSKTKRLAAAGNYEAAANHEMKMGNMATALEYFLRAQKPLRAAQVAQKLGRAREAAELYEQGGDLQHAATMYRQAGLTRKAEEAEQVMKARMPAPKGRETKAALGDPEPRDDGLLPPMDRTRDAEQAFEEARRKAETGDPAALARLQDLGREASEALLSAGEIRRAAEVCVEAGLVDQAINLYVNLLGDPGAAAPLFAERGDHKRAAELYEAAGKKERALHSWIECARKLDDPLAYLSQVERLGDDNMITFLGSVVQQRPLAKETFDLHFRIAEAFERKARLAEAVAVLEPLVRQKPAFRNAGEKLNGLKLAVANTEKPVKGDRDTSAHAFAKTMFQFGDEAAVPAAAPTIPELPDLPSLDAPESAAEPPTSPENVFDSPAIERLVSEVAAAAAREATALAWGGGLPPMRPSGDPGSRHPRPATRGIERIEVDLRYAHDEQVRAARDSGSIEEVKRLIGNRSPVDDNAELYYRLGLMQAAAGMWGEAQKVFSAIASANPGYKDASARAEELGRWQKMMPLSVSGKSLVGSAQPSRYTLQGEIGRGGMAVVYRARDEALERDVALKFLSEEISGDAQMRRMFEREAKAAAQLNHPNVVTVYDIGEQDGRAFISMELVIGSTVESLIEREGKLKVVEALRVMRNVLEGLDYAHSKGIIHRDLKPSNMMRNDLGVVKVMDFGLARSVEAKGRTTIIAGTPNYMPPEQFTGTDMDASSDIFALGASLYEMLTGRVPFDGMDRSKPAAPVTDLNPTVPKLLGRVVHRAIELDKTKRFQKAKEMLRPIESILGQVETFMRKSRADAAPRRDSEP